MKLKTIYLVINFHEKTAINIARTNFNSIKTRHNYRSKNATFTKLSRSIFNLIKIHPLVKLEL